MKLHLEFSPPFNEVSKTLFETLEFEKELSLADLINFFEGKYGETFSDLVWEKGNKGVFSKFLSIIINGRSYQHDNFLETILKDGDQIVFIYIYFGG
ncbi:MAG: MoaD/ThiS family protein [Candidatus Lokiarchaeota archaeon]|nr:MoaD/ThiS family protein [Candidatus Lokiarchaeota archaeon]